MHVYNGRYSFIFVYVHVREMNVIKVGPGTSLTNRPYITIVDEKN